MTRFLGALGGALLDVLLPEVCVACGGPLAGALRGTHVPGLRWCDGPVLCPACDVRVLAPRPRRARLETGLDVRAGCATHGELVELVGAWKYRGRRGLAWPLARLAAAAWSDEPPSGRLAPLPLHGSRRRERGFNQAEQLARLMAWRLDAPLCLDALCRVRATDQQAKLDSNGDARRRNVAGAFAARAPRAGEAKDIVLVDDLVTSGATCLAAAGVLEAAGWSVRGVAAVGLAPAAGDLDTGSLR